MQSFVLYNNYVIIVYELVNETLFEIYTLGAALGYERSDGKTLNDDGTYRMFPYKSRIDRLISGLNIDVLEIDGKKYLDMTQLRQLLMGCTSNKKNEFIDWLRENYDVSTWELYSTTKEDAMFTALEDFLEPLGYTLNRQVKCGRYRIDAVIPELNVAIEYDEDSHANYNRRAEEVREEYIRTNYDTLIRITDEHNSTYNLGLIVKEIININN